MSDYSSDGVEVLDLTAPTPPPPQRHTNVATSRGSRRTPPLPSATCTSSAILSLSSSLSPPRDAQGPSSKSTPGFELEKGCSSEDEDFDMRPSNNCGSATAANNTKGKGKRSTTNACSAAGNSSSSSSSSRNVAVAGAFSAIGGGGGGKDGFVSATTSGDGERAGVVDLLSDSDDGGGPFSSRLQPEDGGDNDDDNNNNKNNNNNHHHRHNRDDDDDDDCQSVEMPEELEAFDSLVLASQTSHMYMSQEETFSSPHRPSSLGGGSAAALDLCDSPARTTATTSSRDFSSDPKDTRHSSSGATAGCVDRGGAVSLDNYYDDTDGGDDFDWKSCGGAGAGGDSGGRGKMRRTTTAGDETCSRLDIDSNAPSSAEVQVTSNAPRRRGGEIGSRGTSGGGGRGDGGDVAMREAGEAVMSEKERNALARKEATATKKRAREEAAAALRQQKQREREAKQAEKERKANLERERKAAQKDRDQQARGKFSEKEVACIMERRFHDDAKNVAAVRGAHQQADGAEKFMVVPADCEFPGAIWWTRRDHLDGGAAICGEGVETLDFLAVVVPSDVLFPMLGQSGANRGGGGDDVDGFPALDRYVDRLRTMLPGFGRLILVLEGASREVAARWNTRARNGAGCPTVTDALLEDAVSWLLIFKDAETRLTKDSAETGQYLWDLTRALSSMPYKDDVTELHCINRSKAKAVGSENLPKEEQELADTWVRMLSQIPRVSEDRAIAIASQYPLPRALVSALTDPTVPEEQRALLLADKMGSKKAQKMVSRRVFELFTQEDGDFVLH